MVVDLGRRIALYDPPAVHDGHAVGHPHRLFLVMGHEDGRHAEQGDELLDLDLHLHAQLLVEGAEWLVEEEEHRLDGKDTGQRHALLLSPGELVWIAAVEPRQPNQAQHLRHASRDLGARALAHAQPERDVVGHRHVREERIVLEDDADVAEMRQHVVHHLVSQHHLSTARRQEAGDALEQGGLAAAGGPQQSDELAARDVEADAVDRRHWAIASRHLDEPEVRPGARGARRYDVLVDGSGHAHRRAMRVRPTVQWPSSTTAKVMSTSTAEIAAAAGSRSKLIMAKRRMGSVSTRGPARKSETVRLSKDEMKAKAAPVVMPGRRLGRVTRRKVFQALAPRLRAASSRCGSRRARLAMVVRSTYGTMMATWLRMRTGRERGTPMADRNMSAARP